MTTAEQRSDEVIIVGAGPAGLATAACLRRARVSFTVLEAADRVGASWANHYDRLHLHTVKQHSALPYFGFPRSCPDYPSRAQVLDYLERYAGAFAIEPRFLERVMHAERDGEGWAVKTESGSYLSRCLVVATGQNDVPVWPAVEGMERFAGPLLHSHEYRSGRRFAGQHVLVVGCGNSGAEIALDLFEHGAHPIISVRGPVRFQRRDALGLPVQVIGIWLNRLPFALADLIARGLLRLSVGDLSAFGIETPARGPLRQVRETGHIPVVDVGTLALIKGGQVPVVPALRRLSAGRALFADGRELPFDAIVFATGFRAGFPEWLAADAPAEGGGAGNSGTGLHFVGFSRPAAGGLRQINIEARAVAEQIRRSLAAISRGA